MPSFEEMAARRQSCRHYSAQRPTMQQLRRCVEVARLAPSACNSQPWRFVAVNDPAVAAGVGEATRLHGLNAFTAECGAFIVVCDTPPRLMERVAAFMQPDTFVSIDVGIAAAHLCYAAQAQGLDTCIMGCFDEDKLRSLLQLPEDWRVRLVLAVGVSAEDALRPKKRRALDELLTCFGE